jgi:hypothetical protein
VIEGVSTGAEAEVSAQFDIERLILSRWSQAPHSPTLASLLHDIRHTGLFDRFVDETARDATATSELARRSFNHPTGASKLVVTNLGRDLPELRVHFWPPIAGRAGNELSIHNHRWDFQSTVLFGSVRHETFEESPQGEMHFAVSFSATGDRSPYRQTELGVRLLERRQDDVLGAGSSYFLPGMTLHRMTNPAPSPAATLFLRGPYTSSETVVCHAERAGIEAGAYPAAMKPERTGELLQGLRRELIP